jgi:hypothetical protein
VYDFAVANIVFNFLVVQQRKRVFNAFFSFSESPTFYNDLIEGSLIDK